ncbi:MAG: SDR family oxidoreductase [Oceanobacter sp.]
MAQVIITGANRGIGLAITRILASRGDQVVAVCRETSDELDQLADQVITGIDVADANSVSGLTTVLAELCPKVDVLINNAGIFENETLDNMAFDQIEQQLQINAIAPLRMTMAILPLMSEGGKVANITSRMGSMADNTSGGYYGYRASKAALNAFGKSLAMDLEPRGIAVAQLHPGFVQTRMVNFAGDITPEGAATGLVSRIDALGLRTTGTFWHANGDTLPW